LEKTIRSRATVITGRALTIAGLSLMFLAYSNFVPTSLSSDQLPDYIKNHFVREVIFGITLAAYAIRTTLSPIDHRAWAKLATVGSIVVLPFWIAALFGWSTGGIEEVWGGATDSGTAYLLHGSQVATFYLGIAILRFSLHRVKPA